MNAAPSALNRYAAFPLQSVCSRHVADLAKSPIPNQVIFPENEQLLGFDGMEGIVAYPVGEYYRRNRGTSASDHSRTRGRAGCFPHRVGRTSSGHLRDFLPRDANGCAGHCISVWHTRLHRLPGCHFVPGDY